MLRIWNKSYLISYLGLRRLIGLLGILLPFVCVAGGCLFSGLSAQRSISYYYHTNMRDFFVGLLMGVGMFLITYKGYELIDNIVTSLSGLAGIGIATFPCLVSEDAAAPIGIFQLEPHLSDGIHVACAALFFGLLAVNSIFLFTLSKGGVPRTSNKKKRDIIYIACGVVILLAMAALVILQLTLPKRFIDDSRLVLIFEAIMLCAFGFSWLVKGETLLKDGAIASTPGGQAGTAASTG